MVPVSGCQVSMFPILARGGPTWLVSSRPTSPTTNTCCSRAAPEARLQTRLQYRGSTCVLAGCECLHVEELLLAEEDGVRGVHLLASAALCHQSTTKQ